MAKLFISTILDSMDIDNSNCSSPYIYEGRSVPRVTEILSAMLHEQYLMEWSNSMGLYKHCKYTDLLNKAADIGSYVHKAIELYLSENKELNKDLIPKDLVRRVHFAFNSFLEWWSIIKKTTYTIIYQEHTIICKYFGGTLDLFIEINGRKFIVDFKTSNHASYKYFLQLSAYRYMLEEQGETVDGVIVLMLDKKSLKFSEYVLDFNIPEHLVFIDKCKECFLSLAYAYYNRYNVEYMFKNLFGRNNNGYSRKDIFAKR